MRFITILVAALAVAGCQPSAIDGSSTDAAKQSIEKMKAAMGPAERDRFEEALKVILGDSLKGAMGQAFTAAFSGGTIDTDGMAAGMMARLDGKTPDQVVAEADRILAERAAREREQAMAEIGELRGKRDSSEEARAALAAFEVLRSRFFKRKGFVSEDPIIELKVRNGTDQPISRAYFRGTLATPGRAVPWLKEEFNYQIRGGLEPGEEAEWSLAPNSFGAWGQVDAQPDMVFTVEVIRLDGPGGEKLFATDWDDKDEQRLAALLGKFGSE